MTPEEIAEKMVRLECDVSASRADPDYPKHWRTEVCQVDGTGGVSVMRHGFGVYTESTQYAAGTLVLDLRKLVAHAARAALDSGMPGRLLGPDEVARIRACLAIADAADAGIMTVDVISGERCECYRLRKETVLSLLDHIDRQEAMLCDMAHDDVGEAYRRGLKAGKAEAEADAAAALADREKVSLARVMAMSVTLTEEQAAELRRLMEEPILQTEE